MSLGQHKRDVTSLKYCAETKRLFSVSQNIIKVGVVEISTDNKTNFTASSSISSKLFFLEVQ